MSPKILVSYDLSKCYTLLATFLKQPFKSQTFCSIEVLKKTFVTMFLDYPASKKAFVSW